MLLEMSIDRHIKPPIRHFQTVKRKILKDTPGRCRTLASLKRLCLPAHTPRTEANSHEKYSVRHNYQRFCSKLGV